MEGEEVVLFADTFNRYFEPDNLRDAETVLRRAGFAVVAALPADADRQGSRPLCLGRTFLAAGLVEEAKPVVRRSLPVLGPAVPRCVPMVGPEPPRLLTCLAASPASRGDVWSGEQRGGE